MLCPACGHEFTPVKVVRAPRKRKVKRLTIEQLRARPMYRVTAEELAQAVELQEELGRPVNWATLSKAFGWSLGRATAVLAKMKEVK